MSVLSSIIVEELDRLESLRKGLSAEIASFPLGALSIKKKSGKRYAYKAYRKNGKVVTDYIGSADSKEAINLASAIRKRRDLAAEHKAVSRDIAQVRKMLHASNWLPS